MDSSKTNSTKDRMICVSFPRSGSRYLRRLIMECYPEDFIYYEPYKHKFFPRIETLTPQDANLIKTHDFQLAGKKILTEIFPSNRRYLIQIRKPLDAIISWYEFELKVNSISVDDETVWLNFLEEKIIFWKSFYDLWVRNLTNDCILVVYDNLFNFTLDTLSNVLKFINVNRQLDIDDLQKNIMKIPFIQYGHDRTSKKDKKRDIKEFKYYDAKKFNIITSELEKNYPLS